MEVDKGISEKYNVNLRLGNVAFLAADYVSIHILAAGIVVSIAILAL